MYWLKIELWDGSKALFNLDRVDGFVSDVSGTLIYVTGCDNPFVTKTSINDILDIISSFVEADNAS